MNTITYFDTLPTYTYKHFYLVAKKCKKRSSSLPLVHEFQSFKIFTISLTNKENELHDTVTFKSNQK